MPKMSNKIKFKRKSFGEYFVIRKKLFYVKRNVMCRENFSILCFIFLGIKKIAAQKITPQKIVPQKIVPYENTPYEYFPL